MTQGAGSAGLDSVRGVTAGQAAALVLGWALAALLARSVGIWLAVGTGAVLLGTLGARWGGRGILGRGRHRSMVPAGAMVGLLMVAGTVALYGPLTRSFPSLAEDVLRLREVFRSPGMAGTVVFMPVVLAFEEIVWRGAVHEAVARHSSPVAAAAIGTLLYTVAHLPYGSPALVLAAAGAGTCWALLRALSDSLPAVITAHAVWNYAVLVVYPWSFPS